MALTRKVEVIALDEKQNPQENCQTSPGHSLTTGHAPTTGHALTKSQKRKHPEHEEAPVQSKQKKRLIFNDCSFSGPRYGPEFVLQVA